MEAPEILYVDIHQNLSDSFLYAFAKKDNDSDIEYVHKDAFIEKACQWLKDNHENIYIRYLRGCKSDDEILLFKDYMEGKFNG